MKKMWKITAMLILCGACLMGCTSTQEKKAASVHSKSELNQMNLEELEKKIKNKDEFMVMITQSTCSYCNTMKRTLIPYFREHPDVEFYEIEMDMLGDKVSDTEASFSKLQALVPSFSGGTPEYLYYKDGTLQKQQSGEMSEIAWNNFMIECGMVQGKKQEEKTESFTLAESKQFKNRSITDIAKLLKEKKDFYFYFAAEDRYNATFSKKLKDYVEKNKIEIIMLNNSQVEQPASEKENEDMNTAVEVINKAMTIEIAPSVFHIKNGKQTDMLKDNVTEKELQEWFEKQ